MQIRDAEFRLGERQLEVYFDFGVDEATSPVFLGTLPRPLRWDCRLRFGTCCLVHYCTFAVPVWPSFVRRVPVN